ncbi:hypothetical protein HZS_1962, partial [Henneguya salminicola]
NVKSFKFSKRKRNITNNIKSKELSIKLGSQKLMASEFRLCCPKEYYNHFIKNNIRPDNRNFDEYRSFEIETDLIPSCEGSAIVKIGKTILYCGIKAELVLIENCKSIDEFVTINFDFTSAANSGYRFGISSEDSQCMTQYLNEIWKICPLISDSDLIINEKVRWVLYVDFVCVSRDGAILDASVIALYYSFKSLSLPVIEMGDDVEVRNNHWKPVVTSCPIICTTYARYDVQWIADPTEEEINVCEGVIYVVTD